MEADDDEIVWVDGDSELQEGYEWVHVKDPKKIALINQIREDFKERSWDMTPLPGHLVKIIRDDNFRLLRNRKYQKRQKAPKNKRISAIRKARAKNLFYRHDVKYIKKNMPEFFKDTKWPLLPIDPPFQKPIVPNGASSREFAIIMAKYIQWEKFLASGFYKSAREYLVMYNPNRKKASAMPSKFSNIRCTYDGFKFDSLLEKNRYIFLKLQQKYNVISDLTVHPSYPLGDDEQGYVMIKSKSRNTKCTYTADFNYYIVETDEEVIEDVKSLATLEEYAFKVKRGVFEWFYNKTVNVVISATAKPGSTKY